MRRDISWVILLISNEKKKKILKIIITISNWVNICGHDRINNPNVSIDEGANERVDLSNWIDFPAKYKIGEYT